MDPLPETREALDSYGPFTFEDDDLSDRLEALGEEVQAIVPECMGISLSLVDLEVTFTLVASAPNLSVLDAVQYVDDGPCLAAIEKHEVVAYRVGPERGTCDDSDDQELDEDRWHLFARASAAQGVASTLSMPIMRSGQTIGGFNMYASTASAFDGHHQELADVLGTWAGGAVTNADLSWRTRDLAARAPLVLRESTQLAVSAGLLSRTLQVPPNVAEDRIRMAAVKAGVNLPTFVDSLVHLLGESD